MKTRTLLILIVTISVTSPSAALAQDVQPQPTIAELRPGALVRTQRRGDLAWREAHVVRVAGDSLFMRSCDSCPTALQLTDSLQAVQLATRGVSPARQYTAAAIGAAIGGYAAYVVVACRRDALFCVGTLLQSATTLVGATVGAAAGWLAGSALPARRWVAVTLPAR